MASKYYKGYKFIKGGKSRPGIIGVKPRSGGVVDEFKSKKLKENDPDKKLRKEGKLPPLKMFKKKQDEKKKRLEELRKEFGGGKK